MEKKIYLAGSFYEFRDNIIRDLPGFDFHDPRKHRQHSIASVVEDDMKAAKECPVLLACFPEGRTRGTMTYAEIGASKVNGNYIVVADENEKPDFFLDGIADTRVSSIGKAVHFLRDNKELKTKEKIIKKNDNELHVLLATNPENFMEIGKVNDNGKRLYLLNELKNIEDLSDIDLTVAYFPREIHRNKKAVFFMGASYALDIPIVMIDENPIIYPPLAGLARRIFTRKDIALEYLVELNSQKIEDEAKLMYDLFKKYRS